MKKKIEQAKNLVKSGDFDGAMGLFKEIISEIKGLSGGFSVCEKCGADTVLLTKNQEEYVECHGCGAVSIRKGSKEPLVKYNGNDHLGDSMLSKKEVIEKMWELYRLGDADVTAWDVNRYELTGLMRKSLVEKLGLQPVEEKLEKAVEASDVTKEELKKAEDALLKKEEILQILFDMFYKNEEPSICNKKNIVKFDVMGEIDEALLKIVYKKAGKDYYELSKAVKKLADKKPEDKVLDLKTDLKKEPMKKAKKEFASEGKQKLVNALQSLKDQMKEVKESSIQPNKEVKKEPMKKASKKADNFVSREISHLITDKGMPQKQAIAVALNVARKKGYKKSMAKAEEKCAKCGYMLKKGKCEKCA